MKKTIFLFLGVVLMFLSVGCDPIQDYSEMTTTTTTTSTPTTPIDNPFDGDTATTTLTELLAILDAFGAEDGGFIEDTSDEIASTLPVEGMHDRSVYDGYDQVTDPFRVRQFAMHLATPVEALRYLESLNSDLVDIGYSNYIDYLLIPDAVDSPNYVQISHEEWNLWEFEWGHASLWTCAVRLVRYTENSFYVEYEKTIENPESGEMGYVQVYFLHIEQDETHPSSLDALVKVQSNSSEIEAVDMTIDLNHEHFLDCFHSSQSDFQRLDSSGINQDEYGYSWLLFNEHGKTFELREQDAFHFATYNLMALEGWDQLFSPQSYLINLYDPIGYGLYRDSVKIELNPETDSLFQVMSENPVRVWMTLNKDFDHTLTYEDLLLDEYGLSMDFPFTNQVEYETFVAGWHNSVSFILNQFATLEICGPLDENFRYDIHTWYGLGDIWPGCEVNSETCIWV